MTWRQIVDRSEGHIARLAPGFKERVAKWYQELIMKKIPVLIYCSTRTPAEQDELFKKRPKVTNARGTPVCQSFHCYGRAVDAVPLAQSSTNGLRTLSWETPHFEDADYKDWRELAGKTESENSPGISGGTKLVRKSSRLPLSTSRKVSLRKP
jgi:hypothetical protein